MSRNPNHNYSDEKLLKVLITFGVIAILFSVYVRYVNPYIVEILSQKRDLVRIQDLSSISSALNKLQNITPNLSLGEPNKVYISLPSPNVNCDRLELPSLPDGWEYRCKPETEYRKADGNGWLPIDFTNLSNDSPFGHPLPIDPINTASNNSYYTYIAGEGWTLTSLLESNKLCKQKALINGSTDPARFETGPNFKLWAEASRLVGYWKFDKEQGIKVTDSSGQDNTGTLVSNPIWVDGKLGKALFFDGVDDYMYTPLNGLPETAIAVTVSFWAKTDAIGRKSIMLAFPDDGLNRFNLHFPWAGIIYWDFGNINAGGRLIAPWDSRWTDVMAHWVFVSEVGIGQKIYKNAVLIVSDADASPFSKGKKILSIGKYSPGVSYFKGIIEELRIYNRALTAKEIQTMYNTTK